MLDRSEGALLVAERAIEEVRELRLLVEELRSAARARPSFLIDEAGVLQCIGSDGEVKAIGRVQGRDGTDAVSIVAAEIAESGMLRLRMTDGATLEPGVVVGPKGDAGRDGFSLTDFSVEKTGDREVTLRFADESGTKEFVLKWPITLYRKVWREGVEYEQGDEVTFGGSQWIAMVDKTTQKPELGTDWVLANKRGRDGKDGKDGKPGERGPDGRPGRDGGTY
jgi:hypothetical protein